MKNHTINIANHYLKLIMKDISWINERTILNKRRNIILFSKLNLHWNISSYMHKENDINSFKKGERMISDTTCKLLRKIKEVTLYICVNW